MSRAPYSLAGKQVHELLFPGNYPFLYAPGQAAGQSNLRFRSPQA
jgi:hypothetical protein